MKNTQEEYDARFPEQTHEKKEYFFSKAELNQLQTFSVLQQMGQMAEVMSNNYVNNVVVPRAGVTVNPQTGILYDVNAGKMTIYVPKEETKLPPAPEEVSVN